MLSLNYLGKERFMQGIKISIKFKISSIPS